MGRKKKCVSGEVQTIITYPYQLTDYNFREDLLFAEKQLKEAGGIEGQDYEWREQMGKWAIFNLRKY